MGLIEHKGAETVVRIDTPAGCVVATAHARPSGSSTPSGLTVDDVTFVNVAAFVDALDEVVAVVTADGSVRNVRYDIALVVRYYAYINVASGRAGVHARPLPTTY